MLQGAALPASALEADVLPPRVQGYRPADLDALCTSGEVVWVGAGGLGRAATAGCACSSATRSACWRGARRRRRPARRRPARRPARPPRPARRLLLARPAGRPRRAPPSSSCSPRCGTWCGPARSPTTRSHRCGRSVRRCRRPGGAGGGAAGRRRPGRGRGPAGSPGSARRPAPVAGRWSRPLLEPAAPPPTEAPHARACSCSSATACSPARRCWPRASRAASPAVYPVLKALEERGQVRRGYFVAGLGAAQFALPGAVDRLRVGPRRR